MSITCSAHFHICMLRIPKNTFLKFVNVCILTLCINCYITVCPWYLFGESFVCIFMERVSVTVYYKITHPKGDTCTQNVYHLSWNIYALQNLKQYDQHQIVMFYYQRSCKHILYFVDHVLYLYVYLHVYGTIGIQVYILCMHRTT